MVSKFNSIILRTTISFCLLLFSQLVFSQGRLGFLAGGGVVFYNGDLNEKTTKIISPSKVFKPFFRLGLNYRIGNRLESSLSYFYGNIGGADSLAQENDNRLRNLSFKSYIHQISLQFEYHLFSVYKSSRINPFIFAGVGVFQFNPTAVLNGITYELQPIGTEGQYLNAVNYSSPYKLTQMSLPIGIGIYFQLSKYWRLKIDYTNHFTFTDYLDDVSTIYPDSTILSYGPNGALAVALSSRRLDGYPPKDRSRGNSKFNDSFSDIGVTLLYNPGQLHIGRGKNANKAHRNYQRFKGRKTLCPDF